ncbi:MAG: trigger factor [Raineya sp.]|nr:hypothetical protein [Raineya sp.]MDW8296728.1 trigger factor [Raineya sp.]
MEILFEKETETRGKLSITLKPEDYLGELEKELKKIASKAHIKGFRPGKTPVSVIKNLYGNEILSDTVFRIFSQNTSKYLHDNNIPFLFEPIPPKDYQPPRFNIRFPESYSFQVELLLVPPFELTTEGLSVTLYKVVPTEEEKVKEFEAFLESNQKFKQIEKVENPNDFVFAICYFESENTENQEKEKIDYSALFPLEKLKAEVREKLIGLRINDEVELYPFQCFEDETQAKQYVFGTDSKDIARLQDKPAKVKITRIQTKIKPELNEEFFKQVFPNEEITDENTFKEKFFQDVLKYFEETAVLIAKNQLQKEFIKKNAFEIDLEALQSFLIRSERLSPEELQKIQEKPDIFIESIRWEVLSNRLIEKYQIQVSFDEVQEKYKNDVITRITRMGLNINPNEPWLKDFALREFKKLPKEEIEHLYSGLLRQKALDKLFEETPKTEVQVTIQEFNEKAHKKPNSE